MTQMNQLAQTVILTIVLHVKEIHFIVQNVQKEEILHQDANVMMELMIKMESVYLVNTHVLNVILVLLIVPNVLEPIEMKVLLLKHSANV